MTEITLQEELATVPPHLGKICLKLQGTWENLQLSPSHSVQPPPQRETEYVSASILWGWHQWSGCALSSTPEKWFTYARSGSPQMQPPGSSPISQCEPPETGGKHT